MEIPTFINSELVATFYTGSPIAIIKIVIPGIHTDAVYSELIYFEDVSGKFLSPASELVESVNVNKDKIIITEAYIYNGSAWFMQEIKSDYVNRCMMANCEAVKIDNCFIVYETASTEVYLYMHDVANLSHFSELQMLFNNIRVACKEKQTINGFRSVICMQGEVKVMNYLEPFFSESQMYKKIRADGDNTLIAAVNTEIFELIVNWMMLIVNSEVTMVLPYHIIESHKTIINDLIYVAQYFELNSFLQLFGGI